MLRLTTNGEKFDFIISEGMNFIAFEGGHVIEPVFEQDGEKFYRGSFDREAKFYITDEPQNVREGEVNKDPLKMAMYKIEDKIDKIEDRFITLHDREA